MHDVRKTRSLSQALVDYDHATQTDRMLSVAEKVRRDSVFFHLFHYLSQREAQKVAA